MANEEEQPKLKLLLKNGAPKKLENQQLSYSDYKQANTFNLKLKMDKGTPMKLDVKPEYTFPKKS